MVSETRANSKINNSDFVNSRRIEERLKKEKKMRVFMHEPEEINSQQIAKDVAVLEKILDDLDPEEFTLEELNDLWDDDRAPEASARIMNINIDQVQEYEGQIPGDNLAQRLLRAGLIVRLDHDDTGDDNDETRFRLSDKAIEILHGLDKI